MSRPKLKYDPPVLRMPENSDWNVCAYIYHPDTGKKYPYRKATGLNIEGLNKSEKIRRGRALAASMLRDLQDGSINPWPELDEAAPPEDVKNITVTAALLEAFEIKKKSLKRSSPNDYSSCMNIYIATLDKLGLGKKRLVDFKRREAIQTLEQIQTDRGFGDFRWNIYKERISSLFSVCVDLLEYIPINPLHRVPQKKYETGKVFEPPTDEQQKIIDLHLFENHRPLFLYKAIIYVTGVRPRELLSMRMADINFNTRTAVIHGDDVKTNKSKTIPLTDELIMLLNEHLANHIGNPFVFSVGLKPGGRRIHRNSATHYWNIAVIDPKTGLGINRKMYAQKHKGTDDKILAGIPLDYLRQVYGHSSSRMTERYASTLKQQANDYIRDNAPGILDKMKEK